MQLSTTTEASEWLNEDMQKLYQRMVSKFMYAMIGTCPDLAFAVATLANFTSIPRQLI